MKCRADKMTRRYHIRDEQLFSNLFLNAIKNGLSSLIVVPEYDMRLKIIEYFMKRVDTDYIFETASYLEYPGIHIVSDASILNIGNFKSVGIVRSEFYYENEELIKEAVSSGVPILISENNKEMVDYWSGTVDERIIPDYPKDSTYLQNERIREMFHATFSIAEEEVDIISPWINGSVVNENLKSLMGNALERGVRIRIKYGIGDGEDVRSQTSEKTVDDLRKRFRHYGDRLIIRNTNTHEKMLLCDNIYMMIGSYNFLSFAGDYEGTDIRAESVKYDTDPVGIAQLRLKHFSW